MSRIEGILTECRCRECRAGDALPIHRQGIPGARQLTFIQPGAKRMSTMEDQLKEACRNDCAQYGEPPCFEIVADEPSLGPWKPCADCLKACGLPPDPEPLDPDAVVAPLL